LELLKSEEERRKIILVIIPILTYISIFLVVKNYTTLCCRGSILFAGVVWGLLLTTITELLSIFNLLNFSFILGAWSILLVIGLLILAFSGKKFLFHFHDLHFSNIPKFELLLMIYLFLMITTIGVIAWVAPPNTWDSMTYHMSRVMHWIQDGSIAFYPTHILRQLHQNPWSEFAVLHFQVLVGNDRFANFVQWLSMVGSILGVSLLAKELGLAIRGQVISATICATIPMGILQGSSTQTDYVISFWLVSFIYFILLLRKDISIVNVIGAGGALGLGCLSKATMYIFAFPFMVWLGFSLLRKGKSRNALYIGLILLIAFVTNLGYYIRNYELYNSPLGPGSEGPGYVYTNDLYSLPSITSNVLRNVGLHLGTPWSPVNSKLNRAVYIIHNIIGISPNDPRTTWTGTEFRVARINFHEDTAGNLIHLLLVVASLIAFIIMRPLEKGLGIYAFSIIFAFILFCAYLRWQPWNSRLQLPLFVLFAPFISLSISRIQNRGISNIIILLIILAALPWVFYNQSRPILGRNSILATSRIEQYFRNNSSLYAPYLGATQYLSDIHCSEIGIITGQDDWEYPLWVLLRNDMGEKIHIESVNVTNISQREQDKNYQELKKMCAIIVLNTKPPHTIFIGNINYEQTWSENNVYLYKRSSYPE
jgi:hypothetical protein